MGFASNWHRFHDAMYIDRLDAEALSLRLVIVILRDWSATPAATASFGESCLPLHFKSITLVNSIEYDTDAERLNTCLRECTS